jgi:glycosyltransferase involved in cell wall biosynthesis
MPMFSFIVPAYNASSTIEKCLNSVIDQSIRDWEAIVIDDGSIDDTYSKLCNYGNYDKRIHSYTQVNSGPGVTRNNALKKAVGKYVIFLDSDDYIDNNYLSSVSDTINRENADVVVIDNYLETPNGKVLRIENLSKFFGVTKEKLIGLQMTGKMPWGGCRKVVKKQLIVDNDIRYSVDVVGEEAIFSFLVFYFSRKISFVGKPIYHYVNQPGSQSQKGDDDPWGPVVEKMYNQLIEMDLFPKYKRQWNAFRVTALVVSLFRISCSNKFCDAYLKCQRKLDDYGNLEFNKIDMSVLENKVKVFLYLLKLNLISILVLISKLKNNI